MIVTLALRGIWKRVSSKPFHLDIPSPRHAPAGASGRRKWTRSLRLDYGREMSWTCAAFFLVRNALEFLINSVSTSKGRKDDFIIIKFILILVYFVCVWKHNNAPDQPLNGAETCLDPEPRGYQNSQRTETWWSAGFARLVKIILKQYDDYLLLTRGHLSKWNRLRHEGSTRRFEGPLQGSPTLSRGYHV